MLSFLSSGALSAAFLKPMSQLAATVFAVLMFVLTAFAAPGCQPLQEGDEAASFSIAPVAAQVAESLCRAPAKTHAEMLAAVDKQADLEDRVEMMAVEISPVPMASPAAFQRLPPATGVPAPWLPGLLRPPRIQHA